MSFVHNIQRLLQSPLRGSPKTFQTHYPLNPSLGSPLGYISLGQL